MTTPSFDIVISGGGLVGSTLAHAINSRFPELKIAIVEAVPIDAEHQPSFDSRAIAIAHGSMQLLDKYGLWQQVKAYAEPIGKIHISDRGHIGKSYLTAGQFNIAALGYVLEVRHLGAVLNQALKEKANIKWYCPNTITEVETGQNDVAITLQDDMQLCGKLLLIADGGQSATRSLVNINQRIDDYNQCAVIANVACQKPHQGIAFERFTEFGPMALLPLTEQRYSLVWCVRPEQVEEMMALDDEAFIERLQNAFGYRAGVLVKAGKRVSYPLMLNLTDDLVGHRFALIGNASHTIHPIAGQGFNLGMRDIDGMVEVIAEHRGDIGSFVMLNQYKHSRVDDLNQVVTMTDSLVRLFSNDSKLMALGRTLGLLSLQTIDCLKQPIAFQSMGLNAKRAQEVK